jgi:hypothetical protein
MSRRAILVTALCAGCRFDAAGVPADGGEAPLDAPRALDAALCTATTAAITVDGVAHTGTATPAEVVLVGDTVALSSDGSCGPTALSFEWQVSPVAGIRDTIVPADDAPAISVYPTLPDAYSVTLTVRAGDGSSASTTIYAFDAAGFAPLTTELRKVRDLDVGRGRLWIGGDEGAHRASLAAPADPVAVRDEAGGEAVPGKVEAVLWDDARGLLWIAGKDAEPGAWRVDYGATPPAATRLDFPFGAAVADDVALVVEDDAGSVAVATDLGVAFAVDGTGFNETFLTGAPAAATAEAEATWVLHGTLQSVDDPAISLGALGGRPTALVAGADATLWMADDGGGIARRDDDGTTPYGIADGLPAIEVRALAIERTGRAAGDVWAATRRGLARWKADRGVWIGFGNEQGLQGFLDLRAVAIAAGPTRAVYAGGAAGVVYAAAQ